MFPSSQPPRLYGRDWLLPMEAADPMQIYDLHRKANTQKQGKDTLDDFWNKLQAIWMTIDRKQPNPMKCSDDITTFNKIKQEQRLYQFLTRIDEKLKSSEEIF